MFKPAHFRGAIAAAGGHLAWFLFAALFANAFGAVAVDAFVLTVALAWLWVRPGIVSALALGLIELAALAINAIQYVGFEVGSREHRAMTVHLVFRVLTLTGLGFGYHGMRQAQARAAEASAAPTTS